MNSFYFALLLTVVTYCFTYVYTYVCIFVAEIMAIIIITDNSMYIVDNSLHEYMFIVY